MAVRQRRRRHGRNAAAAAAAAALAALLAAGCSSSPDHSDSKSSTTPNPTESFSGSPASSLPSALASKKESAASAAASLSASAKAAASAFEKKVSAQLKGSRAAAAAELAKVSGKGNAVDDVKLTGLPVSETGGLRAVTVTMKNTSGETASFAVKVDFADSDGTVVDSSIVGAKDVAAGESAQSIAFSDHSGGDALTPKLAKAQRY